MEDFIIEKTKFVILGKYTSESKKRLAFHKVDSNGIVLAEQPFTKDSAKSIFSVFSNYTFKPLVFSSLIPKDIILANSTEAETRLLFLVKSNSKQYLYFKSDLDLKSDFYSHPNLLFDFKNKRVKIYAYTDIEINDNTKLFIPPFYNINSSCSVCFGSVDLNVLDKLKTFDTLKDYIKNSFFNSVFTHSNSSYITAKYIFKNKSLEHWKESDLKPLDDLLTFKDIL